MVSFWETAYDRKKMPISIFENENVLFLIFGLAEGKSYITKTPFKIKKYLLGHIFQHFLQRSGT